jgi:ferrous iron transport protein A
MSANFTPLSSLHSGQSARIESLHFNVEFSARLRALGVDAGKTVRVLRQASWGGPMHLALGMTEVMLRRSDARSVMVSPLQA